MSTKLERIAEIVAKYPNQRLQTLIHHINEDTLKEKHKQMPSNKAPGIDSITKKEYGENLNENTQNLVKRLRNQAYKPQPVRRVYIPKIGSDKMRPLGIPAYEDRLVQGIAADILNQIYEPEFLDFSYGFRPNRSCHDAIKALNVIIERRKTNYIVDVDIKGFFDNVNHKWMMKFLEHRIQDKNFLRLITRFLKSGIMEEGKYLENETGTPQGGLISPILANVYLHYVIDLWFEHIVKKNLKGECYMVRYADDFVSCFQYQQEANKFYQALQNRLNKFGLEISKDKTKTIEFGRFAQENRKRKGLGKPETFTFLGFTHYCGLSRKGKFRVKRKTNAVRFRAKVAAIKQWLWNNMHTPIKELIKKLNIKLQGHYRYYGITDNFKSIETFCYLVRRQLFKTLKRRSQKSGLTWGLFVLMLNVFPLAKPKIYINIYE